MECTTQETVKQTIFLEIHEKRYMLAGDQFAMVTCSRSSAIQQRHLHRTRYWTALTFCHQTWMLQPRNFLQKLPTSVDWSQPAQCQLLLHPSNGNDIGKWSTKKRPLLNLGSTLATILLVASLILYHIITPHG